MLERIRELYWAEPFVPFTLKLSGGDCCPVIRREFLAIAPDAAHIGLYQSDGAFRSINLNLITDLTVQSTALSAD
jgi:hypothetical protein